MGITKNQDGKAERVATFSFGDLERLVDSKAFIEQNPESFQEIVKMVRKAFGTEMKEDDVYNHLTKPGKTYILRSEGKILAMGAFTHKKISETLMLYVEGIAIHPSLQGKGIFREKTTQALEGEKVLALRTQNPRMHRALEKFCDYICPNKNCNTLYCRTELLKLKKDLASELDMKIDGLGVARGFYGKSLYQTQPTNTTSSILFNEILKVDYQNGDSVLCIGVKK